MVAACSWQSGDFRGSRRPARLARMASHSRVYSTSWSIKIRSSPPAAAVTVLAVASEVLASFIGETLTRLLLHERWPDQFDRTPPEPPT